MPLTATRKRVQEPEVRMFKLRVFRMAVALSSLAALVSAVGADRKWG